MAATSWGCLILIVVKEYKAIVVVVIVIVAMEVWSVGRGAGVEIGKIDSSIWREEIGNTRNRLVHLAGRNRQ
jgi:hypothetical protein